MIFMSVSQFQQGEDSFRGTVKLVEGSLHGLASRHRCRVEGSITAAADTCSSTMRVGGGGWPLLPPPVVADAATQPHYTIGCTESFHVRGETRDH